MVRDVVADLRWIKEIDPATRGCERAAFPTLLRCLSACFASHAHAPCTSSFARVRGPQALCATDQGAAARPGTSSRFYTSRDFTQ